MSEPLIDAAPVTIPPVAGVRIGTTMAGIRKAGRRDLVVFALDDGAQVAAVFTRNRFCAAPVLLCREHLDTALPVRALVVNTGNANAGTGEDGLVRASQVCQEVAGRLGLRPSQVLPFSTGVIMEPLPADRIIAGLPAALADLAADHWSDAAVGIMTTDTRPKMASRRLLVQGRDVTISGIAKGAGMIRPDMATMLAFVATDAAIAPALLDRWVRETADESFNRITVDGDMSTNDSYVLIATGRAGHGPLTADSDPGAADLRAAIQAVAVELAQAIIRDGEGATKFITVEVAGGASVDECKRVAYAVAHSPLVKTAFFASDPNLGRILAAVGYAGVDDLDPGLIDVYLDEVHVARGGGRHPDYTEADGQRVMKRPEITVRIDLGRGRSRAAVWTCDLSLDYVKINADYRS